MDTLRLGIVPGEKCCENAEDETAVPAEFRAEMVRLVRSGRTPGELSRENRILREDKEILAKAAAWFAEKETGSIPRRRLGS